MECNFILIIHLRDNNSIQMLFGPISCTESVQEIGPNNICVLLVKSHVTAFLKEVEKYVTGRQHRD